MAFFDNLSRSITKGSQAALQKTKDLTEITKRSSAIAEAEKQLQTVYRDLGYAYYTKYGGNIDPDFGPMVREIQTRLANIARWNDEISQLKGIVKCPGCGREIAANAQFCSFCGHPHAVSSGPVCPGCGTAVAEDALFCAVCGTKLTAPVPEPAAPVPEPQVGPEAAAPVSEDAGPVPEDISQPEAPTCPVCHSPVPEGALFCFSCGAKLS